MKNITILHLYSDTLDLYGDFFNVKCIKNRIEEMGGVCHVITANLDEEIPVEDADLIYIGHGKARNLAAVAQHFAAQGERIKAAVEAGKVFFVTGNGRLLFGNSFTTADGVQMPGIGLFDYTGADTGKVFTSDVFSRCSFDESIKTYGFINRTQNIIGGNNCPLFLVESGAGDGEETASVEGNHYKNYFGTWQMGPLLARNPAFLRYLLQTLLGEEMGTYDDTLAVKALERTLAEQK
ncbi:MAG: hypothetical protein VB100_07175 [Angelakisella sp.]|nr:hypothetical protein [Angelakisella sp.]